MVHCRSRRRRARASRQAAMTPPRSDRDPAAELAHHIYESCGKTCDHWVNYSNRTCEECVTDWLRAALAAERRRALEEAAQWIENGSKFSGNQWIGEIHAKWIRALAAEGEKEQA